jgi:hypothetical protein
MRRRRIILVVIAVMAVAELTAGVAIIRGGKNDEKPAAVPLPMHPVAGAFRPNGVTLADCSEQTCFEQAFGNIAYREGPQAAIRMVKEKYGDGGDPACHRVVHKIGSASLARFHYNVARTFAAGSSICNSGYYHGVLERALLRVKPFTLAALGRVARNVCVDPKILAVKWLEYSCLHGLGHGLMITTGYALPSSLKICGSLATTWDRQACNGGVFMENISSSYGFTSQWLKDDDLVYPCDWVAKGVKLTCYQLVTSRILKKIGLKWDETAKICAGVERGWKWACFQSFGRDVSNQTNHDPAQIDQLCQIAQPYGGQRDCIVMAAMDLTSNFTGGDRAATLCNMTAAKLRGRCYFAIGAIQGRFRTTDEARIRDCRTLTGSRRLVAQCIAGATGKPFTGVTSAR